jgi:hypothetical protein
MRMIRTAIREIDEIRRAGPTLEAIDLARSG